MHTVKTAPGRRLRESPLDQLRQVDRERLQGKRILAVDDFGPDLDLVHDKLSPLEQELDCQVVYFQDSEAALAYAIEQAQAGTPFDIFSLDCAMVEHNPDGTVKKGINGDKFLKEYAKAASAEGFDVPPVVYHSGSHARGLQAWAYSEFERMRRQDERTADDAVDELIGGNPTTLVTKDTPPVELLDAMSQMLRVHERTDNTNYAAYLASDDFQIATLESDHTTENIAKMARIGHLYHKRLQRLIGDLAEKCPWFLETRYGPKFQRREEELGKDNYRFENLVGDSIPAQANRHQLPGILHGLGVTIDLVRLQAENDFGGDDFPPDVDKSVPVDLIMEFRGDHREFAGAMRYLHESRLNPTSDEQNLSKPVKDLFKHIGDNSGLFSLPEEPVIVTGPSGTLLYLVEQPLLNAEKFTDSEDREVNVSLSRTRLGDVAPQNVTNFFHGLGLSDDDDVAVMLVEDNGCGIPPELLEPQDDLGGLPEIFRYGTTTGGTGIGLGLLGEHIREFNAIPHVESEVGKGTRFYIYFKPTKQKEETK
ncbi:MAG: ATP-binding protein [Methanobacteriota archaeon]